MTSPLSGKASNRVNPADPAVKVAHAWFAQAAKAINAKKYDTPGLDAIMTATFRTRLKGMLGQQLGTYLPGPLPSAFLSESTPRPGLRYIETCDVLAGFSQVPTTHKVAQPFVESAGEVRVTLVDGTWVVSDWVDAPDHRSCTGVKVATPKW